MTTMDTATRNGVDTATLFATLDAVRATPQIGRFQFRATNRWISGTHNQSTLHGFYGAMQEMEHQQPFVLDADHPAVLVGADHGPTPVEFLLHALAACLTAGIANIAAARGVNLESVESTVEGDIDLNGILGLSDDVRNGYEQIRISFKLRGDEPEKLAKVVEQSRKRSAVFDVLTNGVPVAIAVDAG
jgi:uncharacterized OsmC-like protein